ncbi:MAG: hypothetical protein ACTSRA_09190, partial [Promethearchaeota archaeon]
GDIESVQWDSRTVDDGLVTLKAIAYDDAGNNATITQQVIVKNNNGLSDNIGNLVSIVGPSPIELVLLIGISVSILLIPLILHRMKKK